MKWSMILGIFLIGVGVLALVYQGITYTTREQVVDIGPVHISAEKKKTIPMTPIMGAAALVAGALVIGIGRKGAG